MRVRVATPQDRAIIDALLNSARLPALDAAHFVADNFRIAEQGTKVIGMGGLEKYAPDALLKSMVVLPAMRRSGVGTALLDALERHATAAGLRSLLVLTTTAQGFFSSLGYVTIAREKAPTALQQSSEFSAAGAPNAVCMRKALHEVMA